MLGGSDLQLVVAVGALIGAGGHVAASGDRLGHRYLLVGRLASSYPVVRPLPGAGQRTAPSGYAVMAAAEHG